MAGRQCHHCKRWIEPGEPHDCWTTTEDALTRHLSDDLRDAWERLRETAADFGPQRIYASGHAIMFSRKSCYCFVRPKNQYLQLCVFLRRTLKSPQIDSVHRTSKTKVAHLLRIQHRDEVEAPVTTWIQEAYDTSDVLSKGAPEVAKTQKKNAPISDSSAVAGPAPKPRPAPKLDKGKQINRVRRICGSIPGTIEKISHGEPTFFTPKRVFAMFSNNHHGDGHVAILVPAGPGVQEALIEEAPDIYYRPPYVGVSGWVGAELSKVSDEQLGALIREAYRIITSKKARS